MSFGSFSGTKGKESESTSGAPTMLHSLASQSASSTANGNTDAFLGKGSKVVGTLTFTGPAEIDGQIEGEINAGERLTIGEAAVVNAKVNGVEVIIRGTVNGDVVASKRLIIKKPAKITGNLATPNLTIEEGVVFEGKCQMSVPPNGSEKRKVEAIAASKP